MNKEERIKNLRLITKFFEKGISENKEGEWNKKERNNNKRTVEWESISSLSE